MKSSYIVKSCIGLCLLVLAGCKDNIHITGEIDLLPAIYPDYQGVTIPPNIAPLNFEVTTDREGEWGLLIQTTEQTYCMFADERLFAFEEDFWKSLLKENRGKSLAFQLCLKENGEWLSCKSFTMEVASEDIDPYLVYRLIPPGYGLWKEMGIYQRNLEGYEEKAVYRNLEGKGNCVNCHSFCGGNPDKMLLHMRSILPGTYLFKDGKKEKLDTKTSHTISPLVYPYWHPSGNYVAFSVNKTSQVLHVRNLNRIEVYDEASDVVVYDVNKREIVTSALLSSEQAYETFPSFSPDGKYLYYCTAVAVDTMPKQFREVKYSLCRVAFDSSMRTFGTQVDTLYHALREGRSVSFPRVSPDGKQLVFTLSDYGNFSIWHKDADLYSLDLQTGQISCLDALNSEDVESYHSWSSNSRWLVFSSRREDGLYTKPYIAYMDETGNPAKPILLPQRNPKDFYESQMNAYNVPEFVTGEVPYTSREISDFAYEAPVLQVK